MLYTAVEDLQVISLGNRHKTKRKGWTALFRAPERIHVESCVVSRILADLRLSLWI